jgi:hypothetical protein
MPVSQLRIPSWQGLWAEVYLVGANIYGAVKSAEVQQSAPVNLSETLNLPVTLNNEPADFVDTSSFKAI